MEFDLTAIGRKGFEIFGTAPPTQQEVQKAKTILAAAPTSDPIAVARYFEALSETNVDGERYNAEWKVRSNPLIVSFFLEATNYGAGATDRTPWCAALVNWCLKRASRRNTNSASSGSFRCFGASSPAPAVGDIAVFKNAGEDEPCRGKGHVAFWLADLGDSVQVLGGNQGDKVKVSKFPVRQELAVGDTPWLMTVRRP